MKALEKILIDRLLFNEKPKTKREKTFKQILKERLDEDKDFDRTLEEYLEWKKEKAKKNEKKPPPPSLDFGKLAMLLVASFPIIGPLYLMWLMKMLADLKSMPSPF